MGAGQLRQVAHPEHEVDGEPAEFVYTSSKWVSSETSWRVGPRAPLVGEHTEEILGELGTVPNSPSALRGEMPKAEGGPATSNDLVPPDSEPADPLLALRAISPRSAGGEVAAQGSLSRWGTPFPLDGIRILDFTWWLASGGAPRFLSALGAEDIKVEWHQNMDLRIGMAQFPEGGKAARGALGVVISRCRRTTRR